jgi:hypothetical protein
MPMMAPVTSSVAKPLPCLAAQEDSASTAITLLKMHSSRYILSVRLKYCRMLSKESTAFRQNSLPGRACVQAIKNQHTAIIHKPLRQCNAPGVTEW